MKEPILIDCDEVLADFVGACLRLARTFYGIHATRADVTGWDIGVCLKWPEFAAEITRQVNENDLCKRLDEMPGALDWLREIEAEFGVDRVLVCTSPWNAAWLEQRARWLEERGVPLRRQVHCSAKHWHAGYLIDDAQHHIVGDPAKGYAPRAVNRGFIVAAPWNSPAVSPAGFAYARGDLAAALAWLKRVGA